jgi:hypothetical protein
VEECIKGSSKLFEPHSRSVRSCDHFYSTWLRRR